MSASGQPGTEPDAPIGSGPFTPWPARSALRRAITAATRRPEPDCVAALLDLATLPPDADRRRTALARDLVGRLRDETRRGGVEGLIHEYALSSQEGVALMCLAEALLRIPDRATRDVLIRDKIATGDWRAHVGQSPSMFVNAATWGLVVTGKLTATSSEQGLSSALTRLIRRGGEPVIRGGVDLAMRMMGEQFVTGQTIDEALSRSRRMERRGFRYSYDMLGEAATTAEDAARYLADYENAIHAIGRASAGRGVFDGPGISIKLSALHPRYTRAKVERVMAELLPRLQGLARLACRYDIGLNIDAEEADRLELSLDLVEALCFDPDLAGWNGIGFVVQAYGRRCPLVIDWLVDLARRSGHRLMVRLVKGAYWDSEIKRAQTDGLDDFPVFTRKVHTDVSYLACARKLLGAPDAVFPQFATHNAQTLATIEEMAAGAFRPGLYEFQCLHGMGEALYEEVVGPHKLGRPCRIYAPVGTHETLLAYLVRRLLENGANSSFVNRIADESVPLDEIVADPVAAVRGAEAPGAPHPRIAAPGDLYGSARRNSAGLDLADEDSLAMVAAGLAESRRRVWRAVPTGSDGGGASHAILNPAGRREVVGSVRPASPAEIEAAIARSSEDAAAWAAVPADERATRLGCAADAFEAVMPVLIGLLMREAGKSAANAVAEVREAVDFMRYYGAEARRLSVEPPRAALGPVLCISPWNFPLAIFTGQVAAALAAGNAVLAKPAEETPLIAAEAVRLLHEAGIPEGALQLVPGDGEVGAALVADRRVQGVMFTGSTAVARSIQRRLAERLTANGQPVPLVAETGGQNALVVDSSALAEQVVADVIASAFDSAGQRCSALRILCLQDDIAERTLAMLKGAMRELEIGDPARLSVDVGPVISAEARDAILSHVEDMRSRGHPVETLRLPAEAARGTFVAPTLIEIERIADVEREVFGPVLHVLRYRRDALDSLVDDINATGYGLTFGLHTRIDETIARVVARIRAGNVYVNRNVIGAVVGVQPFGGGGLSGTGPKAGGPLYLGRLSRAPGQSSSSGLAVDPAARDFADWLRGSGRDAADWKGCPPLPAEDVELAGPVGERNLYGVHPRGLVAAVAQSETGLLAQIGAILATGNTAVLERGVMSNAALAGCPPSVRSRCLLLESWFDAPGLAAVMAEGDDRRILDISRRVAAREGPILPVLVASGSCGETAGYDFARLVEERSISINTAAAGGNASLMSIG